jgi:hypothetical protein
LTFLVRQGCEGRFEDLRTRRPDNSGCTATVPRQGHVSDPRVLARRSLDEAHVFETIDQTDGTRRREPEHLLEPSDGGPLEEVR